MHELRTQTRQTDQDSMYECDQWTRDSLQNTAAIKSKDSLQSATHQSIEPPAGVSAEHGCGRHCAALQAPGRAAQAACSAMHLWPPAG